MALYSLNASRMDRFLTLISEPPEPAPAGESFIMVRRYIAPQVPGTRAGSLRSVHTSSRGHEAGKGDGTVFQLHRQAMV